MVNLLPMFDNMETDNDVLKRLKTYLKIKSIHSASLLIGGTSRSNLGRTPWIMTSTSRWLRRSTERTSCLGR